MWGNVVSGESGSWRETLRASSLTRAQADLEHVQILLWGRGAFCQPPSGHPVRLADSARRRSGAVGTGGCQGWAALHPRARMEQEIRCRQMSIEYL